jgi:hypothetical protein
MKYLIFFFLIACTSGFKLSTKKECREFEKILKKNWDSKGNKTTISFINSVENTYYECLMNKDTTYLLKLFGASYRKTFSICREAKISYEYVVSVPSSDSSTIWSLYFGIDSIGHIKCAKVVGAKDVKYSD